MDDDPAMVPVDQWPGLSVFEPMAQGARSEVWRGELNGRPVAVRRSKRSIPSLEWELSLLVELGRAGFVVPRPVETVDRTRHRRGWNVQTWIDGRPPSTPADWQLVVAELRRLHRLFRGHGQRPESSAVVDLASTGRSVDADLGRIPAEVTARCISHFDPYLEAQRTVIHGDLNPGNIRISRHGRVGLIDWDEARVDVGDLDLSNLGLPVLSGRRRAVAEAAANAWEALNGWLIEPEYARSRFEKLPAATGPSPAPGLSDGRVTLRPRTVEDVAAQLAGEDEQIVRWLTGGHPTPERVRRHIDNLARCWRADGLRHDFGIYLRSDEQRLIGTIDANFADLDLELDEVNLSYAVFEPWRRQGNAAAALSLALAHLDRTDPAVTPTLKIAPANHPSMALAKSLGFRPVRSIPADDGPVTVLQRRVGTGTGC